MSGHENNSSRKHVVQEEFWKSIINKYEERNLNLENEVHRLGERVNHMDTSVPAVMTYNMAKLAKERPDTDVEKFMNPTTSSSHKKPIECQPLQLPDMQNMSVFSIEAADICYMEKIKELTKREATLITEVNNLKIKQKALDDAKKKIDDFLQSSPKSGGGITVKEADLGGLNDRLMDENKRLFDEVADLKMELKHLRENVEGPKQRELERERRRNVQLEADLRQKDQDCADKNSENVKELKLLRKQLEANEKNILDMRDINCKLKHEIDFLTARMNQMQTDMINQKLSEATTLALMKAELENEKKKNKMPCSRSNLLTSKHSCPPGPPGPPGPPDDKPGGGKGGEGGNVQNESKTPSAYMKSTDLDTKEDRVTESPKPHYEPIEPSIVPGDQAETNVKYEDATSKQPSEVSPSLGNKTTFMLPSEKEEEFHSATGGSSVCAVTGSTSNASSIHEAPERGPKHDSACVIAGAGDDLYTIARELSKEIEEAKQDNAVPDALLQTVSEIKELCDFIDKKCVPQGERLPEGANKSLRDVQCVCEWSGQCEMESTKSSETGSGYCEGCMQVSSCTMMNQEVHVQQKVDKRTSNVESTDSYPKSMRSNYTNDDEGVVERYCVDNLATTTTASCGYIEIVTKGIEGKIITSVGITDSGNIEIITEITETCDEGINVEVENAFVDLEDNDDGSGQCDNDDCNMCGHISNKSSQYSSDRRMNPNCNDQHGRRNDILVYSVTGNFGTYEPQKNDGKNVVPLDSEFLTDNNDIYATTIKRSLSPYVFERLEVIPEVDERIVSNISDYEIYRSSRLNTSSISYTSSAEGKISEDPVAQLPAYSEDVKKSDTCRAFGDSVSEYKMQQKKIASKTFSESHLYTKSDKKHVPKRVLTLTQKHDDTSKSLKEIGCEGKIPVNTDDITRMSPSELACLVLRSACPETELKKIADAFAMHQNSSHILQMIKVELEIAMNTVNMRALNTKEDPKKEEKVFSSEEVTKILSQFTSLREYPVPSTAQEHLIYTMPEISIPRCKYHAKGHSNKNNETCEHNDQGATSSCPCAPVRPPTSHGQNDDNNICFCKKLPNEFAKSLAKQIEELNKYECTCSANNPCDLCGVNAQPVGNKKQELYNRRDNSNNDATLEHQYYFLNKHDDDSNRRSTFIDEEKSVLLPMVVTPSMAAKMKDFKDGSKMIALPESVVVDMQAFEAEYEGSYEKPNDSYYANETSKGRVHIMPADYGRASHKNGKAKCSPGCLANADNLSDLVKAVVEAVREDAKPCSNKVCAGTHMEIEDKKMFHKNRSRRCEHCKKKKAVQETGMDCCTKRKDKQVEAMAYNTCIPACPKRINASNNATEPFIEECTSTCLFKISKSQTSIPDKVVANSNRCRCAQVEEDSYEFNFATCLKECKHIFAQFIGNKLAAQKKIPPNTIDAKDKPQDAICEYISSAHMGKIPNGEEPDTAKASLFCLNTCTASCSKFVDNSNSAPRVEPLSAPLVKDKKYHEEVIGHVNFYDSNLTVSDKKPATIVPQNDMLDEPPVMECATSCMSICAKNNSIFCQSTCGQKNVTTVHHQLLADTSMNCKTSCTSICAQRDTELKKQIKHDKLFKTTPDTASVAKTLQSDASTEARAADDKSTTGPPSDFTTSHHSAGPARHATEKPCSPLCQASCKGVEHGDTSNAPEIPSTVSPHKWVVCESMYGGESQTDDKQTIGTSSTSLSIKKVDAANSAISCTKKVIECALQRVGDVQSNLPGADTADQDIVSVKFVEMVAVSNFNAQVPVVADTINANIGELPLRGSLPSTATHEHTKMNYSVQNADTAIAENLQGSVKAAEGPADDAHCAHGQIQGGPSVLVKKTDLEPIAQAPSCVHGKNCSVACHAVCSVVHAATDTQTTKSLTTLGTTESKVIESIMRELPPNISSNLTTTTTENKSIAHAQGDDIKSNANASPSNVTSTNTANKDIADASMVSTAVTVITNASNPQGEDTRSNQNETASNVSAATTDYTNASNPRGEDTRFNQNETASKVSAATTDYTNASNAQGEETISIRKQSPSKVSAANTETTTAADAPDAEIRSILKLTTPTPADGRKVCEATCGPNCPGQANKSVSTLQISTTKEIASNSQPATFIMNIDTGASMQPSAMTSVSVKEREVGDAASTRAETSKSAASFATTHTENMDNKSGATMITTATGNKENTGTVYSASNLGDKKSNITMVTTATGNKENTGTAYSSSTMGDKKSGTTLVSTATGNKDNIVARHSASHLGDTKSTSTVGTTAISSKANTGTVQSASNIGDNKSASTLATAATDNKDDTGTLNASNLEDIKSDSTLATTATGSTKKTVTLHSGSETQAAKYTSMASTTTTENEEDTGTAHTTSNIGDVKSASTVGSTSTERLKYMGTTSNIVDIILKAIDKAADQEGTKSVKSAGTIATITTVNKQDEIVTATFEQILEVQSSKSHGDDKASVTSFEKTMASQTSATDAPVEVKTVATAQAKLKPCRQTCTAYCADFDKLTIGTATHTNRSANAITKQDDNKGADHPKEAKGCSPDCAHFKNKTENQVIYIDKQVSTNQTVPSKNLLKSRTDKNYADTCTSSCSLLNCHMTCDKLNQNIQTTKQDNIITVEHKKGIDKGCSPDCAHFNQPKSVDKQVSTIKNIPPKSAATCTSSCSLVNCHITCDKQKINQNMPQPVASKMRDEANVQTTDGVADVIFFNEQTITGQLKETYLMGGNIIATEATSYHYETGLGQIKMANEGVQLEKCVTTFDAEEVEMSITPYEKPSKIPVRIGTPPSVPSNLEKKTPNTGTSDKKAGGTSKSCRCSRIPISINIKCRTSGDISPGIISSGSLSSCPADGKSKPRNTNNTGRWCNCPDINTLMDMMRRELTKSSPDMGATSSKRSAHAGKKTQNECVDKCIQGKDYSQLSNDKFKANCMCSMFTKQKSEPLRPISSKPSGSSKIPRKKCDCSKHTQVEGRFQTINCYCQMSCVCSNNCFAEKLGLKMEASPLLIDETCMFFNDDTDSKGDGDSAYCMKVTDEKLKASVLDHETDCTCVDCLTQGGGALQRAAVPKNIGLMKCTCKQNGICDKCKAIHDEKLRDMQKSALKSLDYMRQFVDELTEQEAKDETLSNIVGEENLPLFTLPKGDAYIVLIPGDIRMVQDTATFLRTTISKNIILAEQTTDYGQKIFEILEMSSTIELTAKQIIDAIPRYPTIDIGEGHKLVLVPLTSSIKNLLDNILLDMDILEKRKSKESVGETLASIVGEENLPLVTIPRDGSYVTLIRGDEEVVQQVADYLQEVMSADIDFIQQTTDFGLKIFDIVQSTQTTKEAAEQIMEKASERSAALPAIDIGAGHKLVLVRVTSTIDNVLDDILYDMDILKDQVHEDQTMDILGDENFPLTLLPKRGVSFIALVHGDDKDVQSIAEHLQEIMSSTVELPQQTTDTGAKLFNIVESTHATKVAAKIMEQTSVEASSQATVDIGGGHKLILLHVTLTIQNLLDDLLPDVDFVSEKRSEKEREEDISAILGDENLPLKVIHKDDSFIAFIHGDEEVVQHVAEYLQDTMSSHIRLSQQTTGSGTKIFDVVDSQATTQIAAQQLMEEAASTHTVVTLGDGHKLILVRITSTVEKFIEDLLPDFDANVDKDDIKSSTSGHKIQVQPIKEKPPPSLVAGTPYVDELWDDVRKGKDGQKDAESSTSATKKELSPQLITGAPYVDQLWDDVRKERGGQKEAESTTSANKKEPPPQVVTGAPYVDELWDDVRKGKGGQKEAESTTSATKKEPSPQVVTGAPYVDQLWDDVRRGKDGQKEAESTISANKKEPPPVVVTGVPYVDELWDDVRKGRDSQKEAEPTTSATKKEPSPQVVTGAPYVDQLWDDVRGGKDGQKEAESTISANKKEPPPQVVTGAPYVDELRDDVCKERGGQKEAESTTSATKKEPSPQVVTGAPYVDELWNDVRKGRDGHVEISDSVTKITGKPIAKEASPEDIHEGRADLEDADSHASATKKKPSPRMVTGAPYVDQSWDDVHEGRADLEDAETSASKIPSKSKGKEQSPEWETNTPYVKELWEDVRKGRDNQNPPDEPTEATGAVGMFIVGKVSVRSRRPDGKTADTSIDDMSEGKAEVCPESVCTKCDACFNTDGTSNALKNINLDEVPYKTISILQGEIILVPGNNPTEVQDTIKKLKELLKAAKSDDLPIQSIRTIRGQRVFRNAEKSPSKTKIAIQINDLLKIQNIEDLPYDKCVTTDDIVAVFLPNNPDITNVNAMSENVSARSSVSDKPSKRTDNEIDTTRSALSKKSKPSRRPSQASGDESVEIEFVICDKFAKPDASKIPSKHRTPAKDDDDSSSYEAGVFIDDVYDDMEPTADNDNSEPRPPKDQVEIIDRDDGTFTARRREVPRAPYPDQLWDEVRKGRSDQKPTEPSTSAQLESGTPYVDELWDDVRNGRTDQEVTESSADAQVKPGTPYVDALWEDVRKGRSDQKATESLTNAQLTDQKTTEPSRSVTGAPYVDELWDDVRKGRSDQKPTEPSTSAQLGTGVPYVDELWDDVRKEKDEQKVPKSSISATEIPGKLKSRSGSSMKAIKDPVYKDIKDDDAAITEEVKMLQDLMKKIKCTCAKAQLETGPPFTKNSSQLESSLSALQMALETFDQKCATKDVMIDVLKKQLEAKKPIDLRNKIKRNDPQRTQEFKKIIDESKLDNPCYLDDLELVTSPIICPCDSPHPAPSCVCNKDKTIMEVTDVRHIAKNNIMLKWTAPLRNDIGGFEIYINGVMKSRIYSPRRRTAIIDTMNLSASLEIRLCILGPCAKDISPAIAYYNL